MQSTQKSSVISKLQLYYVTHAVHPINCSNNPRPPQYLDVLLKLINAPSDLLGLLCHSCVVKPPPRAPGSAPSEPALCSQFDGSDRFVVNCSQSTFCQTRTYRFHHKQGKEMGEVVIVERGCAQQSYQHQALVRGKWRTVTTVLEEVYTSGCMTDREWAGPLSSDTEYCYCQEDKCNGQMQGDTVADEEPRKASSTYNATSPDSLPHPIDSQLFYNLMKSGTSELIPKASFMTLCVSVVAKLL